MLYQCGNRHREGPPPAHRPPARQGWPHPCLHRYSSRGSAGLGRRALGCPFPVPPPETCGSICQLIPRTRNPQVRRLGSSSFFMPSLPSSCPRGVLEAGQVRRREEEDFWGGAGAVLELQRQVQSDFVF